jgi:hypothetical protein
MGLPCPHETSGQYWKVEYSEWAVDPWPVVSDKGKAT